MNEIILEEEEILWLAKFAYAQITTPEDKQKYQDIALKVSEQVCCC
jgi:hypothetical protein